MGWRRDGDFDHRWKSDLNYRKADMFEQMVHFDAFSNGKLPNNQPIAQTYNTIIVFTVLLQR